MKSRTVQLPPGTRLAEGAVIQAPKGYQVVQGAGAVRTDNFQLPEQRAAARRQYPVSKLHPSVHKGVAPEKVLFLSDTPRLYSTATKRSVRRST